jgi:hypothetical protein
MYSLADINNFYAIMIDAMCRFVVSSEWKEGEMTPEAGSNDVEALEREARAIEHEADAIHAEAEKLEHLSDEMKHRAKELEREAEQLQHRHHPPIPPPRPVPPPRVHAGSVVMVAVQR